MVGALLLDTQIPGLAPCLGNLFFATAGSTGPIHHRNAMMLLETHNRSYGTLLFSTTKDLYLMEMSKFRSFSIRAQTAQTEVPGGRHEEATAWLRVHSHTLRSFFQ